MAHKLTVRLDDPTWKELRPRLRRELGCSTAGFYEAVSRLYLAGELPAKLLGTIAPLAREVDAERSDRGDP